MGDVMFGELLENLRTGLRTTLERGGEDPFAHVRPVLAGGDLNVINLECVLSDTSILPDPFSRILIAPVSFLDFLTASGINVVTTANNHALDHGSAAFERSCDLLRSAGIHIMGYGRHGFFQKEPVIVEVKGRRVGFLGYNTSNFPDADRRAVVDRITAVTTEIRAAVDTLVVSMHWGEEYTNMPPPHVLEFGRRILDAGCDILHGHHSHQIQGVINDRGRIFAPSLGNFIFDQKIPTNRITAVLQVDIDGDQLSHTYLPYEMNDRFQPEPAPQHASYLEEINGFLAESYPEGQINRFAEAITERVRRGHRANRIRMRTTMLRHFWNYLPYVKKILAFQRSDEKMFSVVDSLASLPDPE